MVDITNLGNSERIKNIHTFLQGNNPLGLADDSAKAILALETACEELTSTEQLKRQRIENAPQLLKPKMMAMKMSPQTVGLTQEKNFNGTALLIETFSTLRQLLHEGNLGELQSRLQLLNANSESWRNKGNELLNSFADSTQKADSATADVLEAQNKVKVMMSQLINMTNKKDEAGQLLNNKKESIVNVKSKLTENDDILAQVESLEKPITEEAYQAGESAKANIDQLNTQLSQLLDNQKELEAIYSGLDKMTNDCTAEVNSLQKNFEVLANKAAELAKSSDDERQKLSQFIEEAPQNIGVDGEKWENTLALLTMLTAQLKKAMNEDSIRNMKEQEEVMMKINEASRKDSDKKAKEAAEAERKAADANKAASCTSKILSYVLLAVSVIATVATLGTATPLTLAIAAVGIAIAVTDIVLEETGHGSLMQMLANEISSVVTDILIGFGVPEEKAKQIGSIVGMIVAAVAFLALSLLSMGSAIKNIPSMIKNIPNIIKNIIKTVPKNLTNALGNIATKAAKVGDSVADSADSMVKLSKLAKLSAKFDEAQHTFKAVSQVADKADKSSDLVSIGGQMVKVSDSVADSGDSMVKLSKFTKLADKFDDVQDASKATKQLADKVDDIADVASDVESVAKNVKTQSTTMARVEVGMKTAGAGLTVTNAAATGGLRLDAAASIRDMKEMLAGMMLKN